MRMEDGRQSGTNCGSGLEGLHKNRRRHNRFALGFNLRVYIYSPVCARLNNYTLSFQNNKDGHDTRNLYRRTRTKIQALYLKNLKKYLCSLSKSIFSTQDSPTLVLRTRYRAKNWPRSRFDRTCISIQPGLAKQLGPHIKRNISTMSNLQRF